MKFERTDTYMQKLFEQALFDEKKVIQDAEIEITMVGGKLKAYCIDTDTFLQFPREMRCYGDEYIADVVEVLRKDNVTKYYRTMKGSIREKGSDEVRA
jgi:hypothetical protein